MAAEIERKFLLRKVGERAWITAKRGSGAVREEVEVALAADQFDALWPLTEGKRLHKDRYRVPLDEGLGAEIDVYGGALEGPVTAEVEFDDEAQEGSFQPPSWLGAEVTGDHRYANQSLAREGLPDDA